MPGLLAAKLLVSSVLKFTRSLSHAGSILANSSTSRRPLAGSFTKFIVPRSRPANEALQARVRRIPADNMEDRIIGDRPAEVVRVWPEPVQDLRVAELQAHNVNEVVRSDLSQQREVFCHFGQGDCALRGVHWARISSAGREQPRGRAAGSRPISSKSSALRIARSRGLKRAARADVCEIEDSQNSGLAIRAFVAAFRIDDERAHPGCARDADCRDLANRIAS